VGLLLLRVLVAAMSFAQLATWAELDLPNALASLIIVVSAVLLLIGFLTPVAAVVLIGVTSVNLALEINSQSLEIIGLAAAIALIGPGAFSIDARMFGRREILIPNTQRSRN
jgi:uncharacterized membrane protein YphA (DoxX/SURF4 family)